MSEQTNISEVKPEIAVRNTSFVFVGAGFSPSSYTGEWLVEKEVVSSDWGWKIVDVISSPLVTQITFDGGKWDFRVEKAKITINDNVFAGEASSLSRLTDLTVRFLERQKHLSFTGLGTNFLSVLKIADPTKYLKSNFLHPNKLVIGTHEVSEAGVALVFREPKGGRLTLRFDSGFVGSKLPDQPDEETGVVCQANFHREIDPDVNTEKIVELVQGTANDWKFLKELLESL